MREEGRDEEVSELQLRGDRGGDEFGRKRRRLNLKGLVNGKTEMERKGDRERTLREQDAEAGGIGWLASVGGWC